MTHNDAAAEHSRRENVKLLSYVMGTAVFFGVTLLISFFLVIVTINSIKIPVDAAANILILGLLPPSVSTFLLFTKVLGRIL